MTGNISLTHPEKSAAFVPLISVVIVNFNVKDYLAQALLSLQRALQNISHEIFVVDNASVDGSVPYLKKHFPAVKIIENRENVGFASANNQALRKVKGEYVVVINPDTVVQEDTFRKLLEFFEDTPDASVATCKIINPDGTFSVDCRHSIPTPSIALWKVLGLHKLFPKSRTFGQYNLTFLDPNRIYTVPAISGSFMMMQKKVLDKVGLFDEQFFMYCEDIDLCHRINRKNFKIYYVPTTQLIHYKGESTKKDNLDYVRTFNRSLYQFFQKYYAPGSIFLFRRLVEIGIFLRGIFIYLKNFLKIHFPLLLDTLILNLTILFSFFIRLELKQGFFWADYFRQYWVINLIASILFFTISFYLDIYPTHRFSIQSIIKANIITFILLAFLTFFLKQFAFSRMVVLMTFALSPLLMLLWRTILRRYYQGDKTVLGKDLFSKPTVVVGNGEDVKVLYEKLQARRDIDYELIGWVFVDEKHLKENTDDRKLLGVLKDLKEIIRIHRVRQVIFSAHSISYEQILKTMSGVSSPAVEYKMVPSNLDVIIGKSHIERLDDYPLLDIDYSIGKKFNRLLKRLLDIAISFPLLLLTLPVYLVYFFLNRKKLKAYSLRYPGGNHITVRRYKAGNTRSRANNWLMLWDVLRGKFSLVGAPLEYFQQDSGSPDYFYKPGLTGLVQLNRDKLTSGDDAEKYHLFYLKNQSVLLDLEIILKSFWRFLKAKS